MSIFNFMNLSWDFYLGILSSLVAALIIWLCKETIFAIRNKSPYSGYWYSLIFENGTIVKADCYYIKHNKRTGEIKGKMKRFYPKNQFGRGWIVNGIFKRQNMILYTHSKELNTSMATASCRFVRDNYYEGYYLRYSEISHDMDVIEIHYYKTKINRRFFVKRKLNMLKEDIIERIENHTIEEKPEY